MLSIIQMVGYDRYNYPMMVFPTVIDDDNDEGDDNHDGAEYHWN